MNYKIKNYFKISLSFIFFIFGFFFIYKGNNILTSFNYEKSRKNLLEKKNDLNLINRNIVNLEENVNIKTLEKNQIGKIDILDKEKYTKNTITVKKNDTFSKIINPFFSNTQKKELIINKLNKEYNLKNLNIGQKIFFYLDDFDTVKKIVLPIDIKTDIVLKILNESVEIKKINVTLTEEYISKKFTINTSLYADGIKSNVPNGILAEVIQLYSFDIDFQRDIQKGTEFSIHYEVLHNSKRDIFSNGKIQYINIVIQSKELEYFLFKTEDGFYDYFNKDGKNIKKAILKTPIDGARLSSNFGMRKHPISGYNKLHKGVDFAAPSGTPIFAGGNGVIEYAGYNGGYGKYIRIRHNNEYKTAYAHLKSFKKGISKGVRINQGDVIGYVGNTGNSTGPHLHYEIIYRNKQINPMKMKLPSGKTLNGKELNKFKSESKNIYAKYLYYLYE